MEIFNKKALIAFSKRHADCKQQLQNWISDVTEKKWKLSADVKKDFSTARILNRQRVVFNVKGNKYRLIAKINYEKRWVIIVFIGTHAEYDRINALTVN